MINVYWNNKYYFLFISIIFAKYWLFPKNRLVTASFCPPRRRPGYQTPTRHQGGLLRGYRRAGVRAEDAGTLYRTAAGRIGPNHIDFLIRLPYMR